jgi:hypothetical protein
MNYFLAFHYVPGVVLTFVVVLLFVVATSPEPKDPKQ